MLVLLTLVCFAPSLWAGFVYDDIWTILHNSVVRSFSAVPDLVSGKAVREGVPDAWRPLMVLSLMVDYQLFGAGAVGYHLHSLLWHLGCVILLWAVVRRWFGAGPLALVAAVLFAVHPAHVEPVSAVNYREDLLAAFFSLAALVTLAPRRAGDRGRDEPTSAGDHEPTIRASLLAGLWLLIGLLGKASAATVPLIYLGMVMVSAPGALSCRLRSSIRGVLSLVGALGLFVVWRYVTAGGVNPYADMGVRVATAGQSWTTAALTGAEVFLRSLGSLLVPLRLSPEYEQPLRSLWSWYGWASLCATLVLVGSTVVLARRRRVVEASGLVILLLAWLPVSGIIPLPNLRADRYAYLPSAGFCLLTAVLLLQLGRARLGRVAVVVLLVSLAGLCALQQRVWGSDLSLWRAATRRAPSSGRAWAGLAAAHASRRELALALQAASRAIERSPESGNAHHVMANVLARRRDFDGAVRHYEHAERLGVRRPALLLANWGWTLHLGGDDARAEAMLRRSIASDPRLAQAHANLGLLYRAQSRIPEARKALSRAVTLAPERQRYRRALEALARVQ